MCISFFTYAVDLLIFSCKIILINVLQLKGRAYEGTPDPMNSVGQRIKDLRVAKGISQEEMAAKLNITRPTYSAIESNKKEPTISELRTICAALDVTLEKFLFSSSQAEPYEGKMEKFKQIILACLYYSTNLSVNTRVSNAKLAALIYLIDFSWYYEYRYAMSGLSYRHTKKGPVVDAFYRMLNDLYDEGYINFKFQGRIIFVQLTELVAPSSSLLSKEEMEYIRRVCADWNGKSTSEILDFIRERTPWNTYSVGEIVPYELISSEPNNPILDFNQNMSHE